VRDSRGQLTQRRQLLNLRELLEDPFLFSNVSRKFLDMTFRLFGPLLLGSSNAAA